MDISCDPLNRDVVYEWLRGSYWSPNIRRDVGRASVRDSLVAGAYVDGYQYDVVTTTSPVIRARHA
jgi:hypothetical protein